MNGQGTIDNGWDFCKRPSGEDGMEYRQQPSPKSSIRNRDLQRTYNTLIYNWNDRASHDTTEYQKLGKNLAFSFRGGPSWTSPESDSWLGTCFKAGSRLFRRRVPSHSNDVGVSQPCAKAPDTTLWMWLDRRIAQWSTSWAKMRGETMRWRSLGSGFATCSRVGRSRCPR